MGKQSLIIMFLSLFLSAASLAPASILESFTCNNVTFSVGDPKGRVLFQCGPPDYEETIEVPGKYDPDVIEEWHYDCGEKNFIKILTFNKDRLTSISNGEQGTGESVRNCY